MISTFPKSPPSSPMEPVYMLAIGARQMSPMVDGEAGILTSISQRVLSDLDEGDARREVLFFEQLKKRKDGKVSTKLIRDWHGVGI